MQAILSAAQLAPFERLLRNREQELRSQLQAEKARAADEQFTRIASEAPDREDASLAEENGGHIHIGATVKQRSVLIHVRDDGIGISAAMLPHIFDMFSQATPALEPSEGGLGIGLALARGLLKLHRGTITARSDGEKRGSEFVVKLPIVVELEAADSAGPASTEAAVPATEGIRVLVADDNPDAVDSLAMLLSLQGYQVHAARTGTAALELADRLRPHAAVLDIGMPGMSGYEVAREIRAAEQGAKMLLIASTGWGQEQDKRHAAVAGFDHHLTKPLDIDELDRILSARFRRSP